MALSPSLAYSQAHFSLKGPLMQIPWTTLFDFVWLCEYLRPRDPLLVLEELQALRLEIARTRDLVYDLEASSGSCLWQLWGQGWLLRLSGLADLVLIFLLIRGWFQRHREPADSAELLEEPSIRALPSSTTSVLSADSRVNEEGSESSTPSPVQGGRPTRPSDLRKWRSSR